MEIPKGDVFGSTKGDVFADVETRAHVMAAPSKRAFRIEPFKVRERTSKSPLSCVAGEAGRKEVSRGFHGAIRTRT